MKNFIFLNKIGILFNNQISEENCRQISCNQKILLSLINSLSETQFVGRNENVIQNNKKDKKDTFDFIAGCSHNLFNRRTVRDNIKIISKIKINTIDELNKKNILTVYPYQENGVKVNNKRIKIFNPSNTDLKSHTKFFNVFSFSTKKECEFTNDNEENNKYIKINNKKEVIDNNNEKEYLKSLLNKPSVILNLSLMLDIGFIHYKKENKFYVTKDEVKIIANRLNITLKTIQNDLKMLAENKIIKIVNNNFYLNKNIFEQYLLLVKYKLNDKSIMKITFDNNAKAKIKQLSLNKIKRNVINELKNIQIKKLTSQNRTDVWKYSFDIFKSQFNVEDAKEMAKDVCKISELYVCGKLKTTCGKPCGKPCGKISSSGNFSSIY